MEPTFGNPEPLSLRIKIAAIFFAVLLALVFLPARWVGLEEENFAKEAETRDLSTLFTENVGNDPDGDGLPNWQEALLGTDPGKSDTDGDGISDGAEINEKTPLTEEDKAALTRLQDSNNLTSVLAKDGLSLSVYLAQQGLVNDDILESIGSGVAEQTQKLIASKTYTASDLNISSDNSPTALKNYGNSLGASIIKVLKSIFTPDDMVPIYMYLENKDPKTLNVYTTKEANIAIFIKAVAALKVPSSVSNLHLMLLNSTEKYKLLIHNIGSANYDPAKALVSVRDYGETILELLYAMDEYVAFFDEKNVVFTQKDPGFIFMKGIMNR